MSCGQLNKPVPLERQYIQPFSSARSYIVVMTPIVLLISKQTMLMMSPKGVHNRHTQRGACSLCCMARYMNWMPGPHDPIHCTIYQRMPLVCTICSAHVESPTVQFPQYSYLIGNATKSHSLFPFPACVIMFSPWLRCQFTIFDSYSAEAFSKRHLKNVTGSHGVEMSH